MPISHPRINHSLICRTFFISRVSDPLRLAKRTNKTQPALDPVLLAVGDNSHGKTSSRLNSQCNASWDRPRVHIIRQII